MGSQSTFTCSLSKAYLIMYCIISSKEKKRIERGLYFQSKYNKIKMYGKFHPLKVLNKNVGIGRVGFRIV